MSGWLGLGGNPHGQNPIIYGSLQVSSSRQNLPIPIFWGQRRLGINAIWYANFQKHSSGGKGKGGGGKGGGQVTYTADVIAALAEGVVDSVVRAWTQGSTTSATTLAALNETFFSGTAGQAPWSYVVSTFPTQARAYAYTAYLGCPGMDLGSAATIPDNNYECIRTNGFAYTHTTSNGWKDPTTHTQYTGVDVLLSDVIPDLLTTVQYGMGFASGDIGDITQYAAYQRAMGLFFSPLLNTQTKGTEVIDRFAAISHSWIYWSGTAIQFFPLGDETVTGNGVTYTPNVEVAYALSVANGDFLGDTPITVQRADPADCYNRVVLQICDRTLGYIANPIVYQDDQLVDLYGRRDASSTQADDICDPVVGAIVAQLLCKRAAYLRNTYQFKASYRLIRLLPGTTLTLTDPNIGLNALRVRVKTVEENEDDSLTITCEEFPAKVSTYQAFQPLPLNTATFPNVLIAPPSVNTPAVIEPSSAYTGGIAQLIVAASGGANWGGCHVHLSFDGTNYNTIGTITSPAVQGLLTANLADHADPDTTNTLSVDCTESLSVPLTSVTHADADALRSLSLVSPQPTVSGGISTLSNAGEMLAFGTVTSTGTYSANLTYLRRGEYGTPHEAHSSGDQFTVVNVLGNSGTSIAYDLPAQYIGVPLYLKFTSFNLLGNAEQDPSTVTEYKYVPTGAGYGTGTGGLPATPTGLTATPGVQSSVLAWNANAAADNVTAYHVYRAAGTGASFGSATLVATVTGLTWNDTGLAANTGYTYFLAAVNAVGEGDHTAGVNLTTATTVSNTYRLYGDLIGNFDPTKAIFDLEMFGDESFTAGLASNLGAVDGLPASTVHFPIKKNGVQVGTMDVTSGGAVSWTMASNLTFTSGDRFSFWWPSPFDPGLTGVHFTFVGKR